MKGLENLEEFAQIQMEFLGELQKMGIKDFSGVRSMFDGVLANVEKVKSLLENTEELKAKVKKVTQKSIPET
jgi:hypothetical protein